jgi:hypothetical protein
VVLFLLDFDQTHGAFALATGGSDSEASKSGKLRCDRDVIRATINVGFDRGRDEAHHAVCV